MRGTPRHNGTYHVPHHATSSNRRSSARHPSSPDKTASKFFAVSCRYSDVARQSESGWKSVSKASLTASIVSSFHGRPISSFSTARARRRTGHAAEGYPHVVDVALLIQRQIEGAEHGGDVTSSRRLVIL